MKEKELFQMWGGRCWGGGLIKKKGKWRIRYSSSAIVAFIDLFLSHTFTFSSIIIQQLIEPVLCNRHWAKL